MIIIRNGIYKNKKLKESDPKITRPTKERVKLGLINILLNRINLNNNNTFLDLFSGTGQIGLEVYSLKRFKNVILNELNLDSFNTIKENINSLNIKDNNLFLFNLDYLDLINKLKIDYSNLLPISFLYLDPPYKMNLDYNFIELLLKNNIINKDSYIIYEKDIDLDESYKSINIKEYKYGRSKLYLINLR